MRRANIVSGVLVLVIAVYIIYEAITMQYTIDNVPGPGFIPFWAGALMALIALIMLYKNGILRQPETEKGPGFTKQSCRNVGIVIGGSTIGMLLVYVLGMLPAMGLLTGFLSWMLGTKSKVTNIALAILTPIVFWIMFEVALEVNFPKGLLGF
jgi:hypothetical protein